MTRPAPALSCETLRVRFRDRTALDGVSAEISAGCLTGIVGPNGAGKTTLLRALCGLIPEAAPNVRLRGVPLPRISRTERAKRLAYLPQGGQSGWPMTARDVVMLGRMPHAGSYASPGEADLAAVRNALDRCDAARFAERHMNALSSGERARVLLARALATQADILLADEPAAFLDPAHQFSLMNLLRTEAMRGAAVAVTLHDLTLAARYCDRILVLDRGRTIACDVPRAALSADILSQVFSLSPVWGSHERLIAVEDIAKKIT